MKILKFIKYTIIRFILLSIVTPVLRLSGKRIIHFLHIGKTGGTAIKAAFNAYPFFLRIYNDKALIFHNHSCHLRHLKPGENFVVFIRDPVSRFVSGFNSRLRQGRPRRFVPWSYGERRAFKSFSSPEELALSLKSSDINLHRKAVQAMNSIEHVCSFQSDWFGEKKSEIEARKSDLVLMGRQESLNRGFDKLKRVLNIGNDIKLPDSPLKAHRSPDKLKDRLSQEGKEAVESWYERDYLFFSYLKEKGDLYE